MMLKKRHLNIIIATAAGFLAITQMPAAAHPMGNFSISHYSRLTMEKGEISLRYLLDFAEIPTVSEMDTDGDGKVTETERENYLHSHINSLRNGLILSVNGLPQPLEMEKAQISARPGAGGLDTELISLDFRAATGEQISNSRIKVEYHDNNFADRTGWKEIVAQSSNDGSWSGGHALLQDRSHELSSYPADAASAPPQDTAAEFEFYPGVAGASKGAPIEAQQIRSDSNRTPQDAFTRSIASKKLTPGIILISLLLAMLFGAMHALSPGHGKAMVAAYLVGARGTAKHAIFLGGVITITHTIGVFALGLITLALSRFIVPERLYPYLSAFSGISIVIIGATLFSQRLKHMLKSSSPAQVQVQSHNHPHVHDHSDEHPHVHDNSDHHPHVHDNSDHLDSVYNLDSENAHDAHHHHESEHSHNHELEHAHNEHHHHEDDHSPDQHDYEYPNSEMAGYHHHGDGIYHSHTVPEDTAISLKSLLVLGITGGVIPCPSALVVMLSAIALHRAVFGLALISAFSVGLAVVLSGVGILVVYARGFMEKLPSSLRLTTRLPVFSAAVVTVIGLVLVINSIRGAGF